MPPFVIKSSWFPGAFWFLVISLVIISSHFRSRIAGNGYTRIYLIIKAMNQEQIKTTVLNHIQQVNQAMLSDIAAKTGISLIQVQWAVKVLEEEKQISSEKTDKGKIIRLAEKGAVAKPKTESTVSEPVKTEKVASTVKKGRDTTKYIFEKSDPLPKGQCVLAVLKAYIRDHKPLLKDLKAAFDDSIVQRYGITQNVSDAKALSGDRDRYFLKEEQILTTKDGKKIACTTQWTSERFEAFVKLAKKQGYTIKAVA
jgi:hypothetical protein